MNFTIVRSSKKVSVARPRNIGAFGADPDEDISESTASTSSLEEDPQLKNQLQLWRIQGVQYAEDGKFEEALGQWQRYLLLRPTDHEVLEMKAQAHLAVDQVLEALQSAESATKDREDWVEGLQTLARCQREIGELYLSVNTYEKALRQLQEQRQDVSEERGKDSYQLMKKELEEELIEVRSLAQELTERRQVYLSELQHNATSLSPEQQEVCRCKYNLAARVKGAVSLANDNTSMDL